MNRTTSISSVSVVTAILCSADPATNENVTVTVGDLSYLSTINYTCLTGHYFPDNSSIHTSVCDGQEQWTITDDQICARTCHNSNMASDMSALWIRRCSVTYSLYSSDVFGPSRFVKGYSYWRHSALQDFWCNFFTSTLPPRSCMNAAADLFLSNMESLELSRLYSFMVPDDCSHKVS